MDRFVVVTDSTANLPPELVSEYDVPMIPLTVHWGEETYLDGVSLDAPTFYKWLQEREAFPTTSQPSPGAFIEFFLGVAKKFETTNILGIFISAELSGTLASAIQAKAELPNLHIELVDSRSTSMVMPLEKVRMRRKSLQRVVEIVKERVNGRRLAEVAVIHAQAGEDADLVEGWIREIFAPEVVYNSILTPVVGTHVGPGTIGVVFYVAD
jgi:fatty acid-binding protein DegV